jgi:hypothetical protein
VSYKVIIAGSRAFVDYSLVREKCDYYLQNKDGITIISGGARGADALGERYAKENDHALEIFPADWDALGRAAGHIRNKQMAKNADALILFWNGTSPGSKSMLRYAQQYGLDIREVKVHLI